MLFPIVEDSDKQMRACTAGAFEVKTQPGRVDPDAALLETFSRTEAQRSTESDVLRASTTRRGTPRGSPRRLDAPFKENLIKVTESEI